MQRRGTTFHKEYGILHGEEVYDAKIIGTTVAFRAAMFTRQNSEKIFVLLDNHAAVIALQTGKSPSSIRLTKLFNRLEETTKQTQEHMLL